MITKQSYLHENVFLAFELIWMQTYCAQCTSCQRFICSTIESFGGFARNPTIVLFNFSQFFLHFLASVHAIWQWTFLNRCIENENESENENVNKTKSDVIYALWLSDIFYRHCSWPPENNRMRAIITSTIIQNYPKLMNLWNRQCAIWLQAWRGRCPRTMYTVHPLSLVYFELNRLRYAIASVFSLSLIQKPPQQLPPAVPLVKTRVFYLKNMIKINNSLEMCGLQTQDLHRMIDSNCTLLSISPFSPQKCRGEYAAWVKLSSRKNSFNQNKIQK